MIRWGTDAAPEWPSKLDRAISAGYDPHPDDLLPPAAHLAEPDGEWSLDPLRAFAAEVEAVRAGWES